MRRISMTLLNLAGAAAIMAGAASVVAQQTGPNNPANNPLAASHVFAYDEMTAKMQPAGTVPNPAHRIQHSELIVVEEGTLEYTHEDLEPCY